MFKTLQSDLTGMNMIYPMPRLVRLLKKLYYVIWVFIMNTNNPNV